MELEFREGLDPEVRMVIQALDAWSEENSLPRVVVTEVLRSAEEQERIYTEYADKLIFKLKTGKKMPPGERELAGQLIKLTRDEVMDWARRRFSWHRVGQAVDMRSRQYAQSQIDRVMAFLRKRCQGPAFELLEHDITAPHIHVAFRRPEKRNEVH